MATAPSWCWSANFADETAIRQEHRLATKLAVRNPRLAEKQPPLRWIRAKQALLGQAMAGRLQTRTNRKSESGFWVNVWLQ